MMTLRLLNPSDESAIRTLWRNNPVAGEVPYYFDAAPFCKPGYRLYLIEWNSRAAGTLSVCPEKLGHRNSLYISDAVLEGSARGRRLMDRAMDLILEETLTPEVDFLTAVYPKGNRGSQALLKRRRILYETSFETYYLPALRHREPEVSSEYAAACQIVNEFYANHAFFHPVTPDFLAGRPGYKLLVEREKGRIVACVGIWKQQKIRRLMLVQPGWATRAALRLVSLINLRLDAAVENGAQELIAHVLTEPAFAPGHEKAFHRLMNSVGWGRDAHALQLAVHPSSPIRAELRRRLAFVYRSVFVVFQSAKQKGLLPQVQEPIYHDYTLV